MSVCCSPGSGLKNDVMLDSWILLVSGGGKQPIFLTANGVDFTLDESEVLRFNFGKLGLTFP